MTGLEVIAVLKPENGLEQTRGIKVLLCRAGNRRLLVTVLPELDYAEMNLALERQPSPEVAENVAGMRGEVGAQAGEVFAGGENRGESSTQSSSPTSSVSAAA